MPLNGFGGLGGTSSGGGAGLGPVNNQTVITVNNSGGTVSAAPTNGLSVSTSGILHSAFPTLYLQHSDLVYVTATTVSISSIACRDITDVTDIRTGQSIITLNTTIFNAANGILQSANQTGTATFTISSATVTGSGTSFTTVFQVGDVITSAAGQSRRITAIASNTSLTVESNFTGATETAVTFRRGGRAPNTHYYLYALTTSTAGPSTGTNIVVLSTRNLSEADLLVDPVSTYSSTIVRQLQACIRTDGSSNIIPFKQVGTSIRFTNYTSVAPYRVLSSVTNANVYTAASLANLVPRISRVARIQTIAYTASGGDQTISVRATGSTEDKFLGVVGAASQYAAGEWTVNTNSIQSIDYKVTSATPVLNLDIIGFDITEVP